MNAKERVTDFAIETLYPDYWNIKNNIPSGLWRNCNLDIRIRDFIPFLHIFCIIYLVVLK